MLDCEAEETPCGDVCCTGEDLCYLGACTTPGAPCESTRDCDDGEYCELTVGRCLPRATGEECEYMPEVGGMLEIARVLEESATLLGRRRPPDIPEVVKSILVLVQLRQEPLEPRRETLLHPCR